MSGFICERCKKGDVFISYVCEICHRHVCPQCIEEKDNKQVCVSCAVHDDGLSQAWASAIWW